MYSIDYITDIHTLEIAIVGFLSEQDVDDFARDLAVMLGRVRTTPAPASLYNYTGAAIQSQAVVAKFQEIARRVKPGRRIALYADGLMARMQARRIATACPTMETFASRAAALAWLRAPHDTVAA